jgi:hydrogenase maturation protein HypF
MDQNAAMPVKIKAFGLVQGIGFRPYVARIARQYQLKGYVLNTGDGVLIEADGQPGCVNAFIDTLKHIDLPHARIDRQDVSQTPLTEAYDGFCIKESSMEHGRQILHIPPDLATCPRCASEMTDPANRRYGHAFISCTACGPRYTIIQKLPYDRQNTTMGSFPLCDVCETEYTDPNDIRCDAQTICCPVCGPRLYWLDNKNNTASDAELLEPELLEQACDVLQTGGVLAIKGIGGYHLAASPFSDAAVRQLRLIKGRERKPFAVMFPDITAIQAHCVANSMEAELLSSSAAPIVLLRNLASPNKPFSSYVYGDSLYCGCFLPYTPVHIILTRRLGPLVMTSANLTEAPIIYQDDDMATFSAAHGIRALAHNRDILRPIDDSVIKLVYGKPIFIRRARGYVPEPIISGADDTMDTFAAGGDLKSVFCLSRGPAFYLSPPLGDLEDQKVYEAVRALKRAWFAMFDFAPKQAVIDIHPAYVSRSLADCLPTIEVQHHHAHIASVLAEHGLTQPVIGAAFDGTGMGTDGRIWGGEFLICSGDKFERAAHLTYVKLAGADSVAKDAAKAAFCYLHSLGIQPNETFSADDALLAKSLEFDINTVNASSMGRLFDAAAYLCGLGAYNGYEGECAAALERAAELAIENRISPAKMSFTLGLDYPIEIDWADVIGTIYGSHENASALALGFHQAVAHMALDVFTQLRDRFRINAVVLSGGVFQNKVLTEMLCSSLENAGFEVYRNIKVPPNDGGLALGQAWIGRRKQCV